MLLSTATFGITLQFTLKQKWNANIPYGDARTIRGEMPEGCKMDPGCTWTFGCTYTKKHQMNVNKSI